MTVELDPRKADREFAADASDGEYGLFMRFGSFIFIPPADANPSTIFRDLAKALESDVRVVDINLPRSLDPRWTVHLGIYPALSSRSALIASDDIQEGLRFALPIRLTLHVPAKNQPQFGNDDVPSEDYFVIWDGFSCAVAWVPEVGEPWAQQTGGHVATEVLGDAARAVGGSLYIQGCDPYCVHQFAHTDLLIRSERGRSELHFSRSLTAPIANVVDILAPPAGGPEELAYEVFASFQKALEAFTNVKNTARRLLDLEAALRDESDDLRGLRVAVAEAHSKGIWTLGGIRGRWATKALSRVSAVMIARIWRGIGRLEGLERVWAGERVQYLSACQDLGTTVLFESDERDDEEAIRSLDLRLIQASVEEGSARLDATSLAKATAGVGIAGMVGVIVGHFL